MENLLPQIGEWITEIIALVIGAVLGSGATFFSMRNQVNGSGNISDQRKARASGDIVGRDKRG